MDFEILFQNDFFFLISGEKYSFPSVLEKCSENATGFLLPEKLYSYFFPVAFLRKNLKILVTISHNIFQSQTFFSPFRLEKFKKKRKRKKDEKSFLKNDI